MGKVYLAENVELGRKEAIKVLKPELASDHRFAARFRREARATSRLYHPNIVALYDAGTLPGGKLFISMEYVDGAPLESWLTDEEVGVPADRALTAVCQLASALEHAHSRGVVHRDLKPANLMVIERRGQQIQLKVLDFGVSKIISPDYQESLRVSQEGIIFGTPLYMAPEQFLSKSNDPRSDIYAIGCIAYELLTGAPPFTGKVSEIVVAHTDREPPPPSQYADDISPELEAAVLRCLEKDPGDRFQTAGDLLAALVPLHPEYEGDGLEDSDVPIPDLSPMDMYETARMRAIDIMDAAEDLSFNTDPTDAGVRSVDDHWFAKTNLLEEHRHDIEDALRDLGSRMLELAPDDNYDVRLSVTLAEVRTLEEELQHCAAEKRRLTRERQETRADAQERRERLAFALRELQGARQTSGGTPDLDYQIAMLSERLREVGNEDSVVLARLEHEEDEVAVRRNRLKEGKRAAYSRLAHVVDELAPMNESRLGELLYHYRQLCATILSRT